MTKKTSTIYEVGIDEVGRGPLAGPVTIGVVVVPVKHHTFVHRRLSGITDSKKLSPQKRESYVRIIQELRTERKLNYATASVGASTIEEMGITYAVSLAIRRALSRINVRPEETQLYLDGSLKADPQWIYQKTIIKGDLTNWLISTASVVAKVVRDAKMVRYGKRFPEYQFEVHKGYGTKAHYDVIKKYGVCSLHRKSWISKL